MSAREITKSLGGQWLGSYGLCQCVCHDDGKRPALKITDDARKDDGVDVHCFAGCDWRDVKAALRERDLLPEFSGSNPPLGTTTRRRRKAKPAVTSVVTTVIVDGDNAISQRTTQAREIWQRSEPAAGTKVETYLSFRAITLPPPPSLRLHPDLRYAPTGTGFPAMVAAVQNPDSSISAVHRTFLLPDGGGKANVSSPKMALGPLGSGAVRLAKAGPVLGLSEGIETALSAQQLFGLPCWAALGSRFVRVALPDIVAHVVLYADNGSAGVDSSPQGRRGVHGPAAAGDAATTTRAI